MPVATADDLLAALRQSNLVPADRLDAWLGTHPGAAAEPAPKLADHLVAAGLLTPYQAGLLLKGRAAEAFIAGKYKVLDLLGQGGMGTVYLCEHVRMRALVAVKVLPAAPDADPRSRDRFDREARAFYNLNHPNLVRGHGVETDGRLHFIVMDYVDGVDLKALVARIGPLPIGRAVNYIRQAAGGLAHAHDRGWVHRDIKPENLAVDRAGVVRVLDMGLAKTVFDGADAITGKFDDGYIRGTVEYMAP
jgi:eukaryotic-like serine/threonine-protein kinase